MVSDPVTAIAMCFSLAAERHGLKPELLFAIYDVERGRPGLSMPNNNGTRDLGLMQINSIWIPELSSKLSMSPSAVERALRDDSCFNVGVSAWILDERLKANSDDLWRGVGEYHSRTPKFRDRYVAKVKAAFRRLYGNLSMSGR